MKKPVIGITTTRGPDPNNAEFQRFFVNRLYADCVAAAGGVPILLTEATPTQDSIELIDGLLIPGGDDIDARHFGQENHSSVRLGDDGRFLFEKSLFESMPTDLPYLGICYGCQVLNVFRGGDLVQHIPDVGGGDHAGGGMQNYRIDKGTLLSKVLETSQATGKSYHHQATGRIGQGLAVSAKSEDGTIEAIEDATGKWIVGVQWHPERTPDDPSSVRLFRKFVDECAKYMVGR